MERQFPMEVEIQADPVPEDRVDQFASYVQNTGYGLVAGMEQHLTGEQGVLF